jgi:hypothetical protein
MTEPTEGSGPDVPFEEPGRPAEPAETQTAAVIV